MKTITAKDIGSRIQELRKDMEKTEGRKITQSNFGEIVGLSRNSIGHYERGERTMDAVGVANVCMNTDVNPEWLLLGVGPMYKNALSTPPSGQEHESLDGNKRIDALLDELAKERSSNRELVQENRDLMKENRDLHIQLVEEKSRAAPDEQSDLPVQKSA